MSQLLDDTNPPVLAPERAPDDLVQRLEQLHAIGASLSAERDIQVLPAAAGQQLAQNLHLGV